MAEPLKNGNGTFWAARILTSVGGLGFFPLFPGTVTSLAGAALFLWLTPDKATLLVAVIAVSFLGILLTPRIEARRGKDAGEITLDELAGQWCAFILVENISWPVVLAGFILFRVFDIIKPFGIDRLQTLPGGYGVVLDDLLAGFYSALVLALLHYFGVF
ncbi:MAG TPA: phosphatidylglycerophosphatase A [Caldithrix abyssi]|uniref:Phosphatidylglycerophosphatase A n=1 Tax=Caldithrix abyssi TaxID=187145 RepID=A0A7V5VE46_CALAY|nr:phosphatidylglycerophosphatase A [Caldithrix abyssi]